MTDRSHKNAATPTYPNPPKLLAEMRGIAAQADRISEKPYRDILEREGFNPDRDYLYLPKRYTDAAGITPSHIPPSLRNRVHITPLSDSIMCVRDWQEKVSR